MSKIDHHESAVVGASASAHGASEALVTVVTPCFNAERYVDRCLRSIVRQTHERVDAVVVDDGSTDRSSEILSDWESRDRRIRVVRTSNQGACAARNLGIEAARGDFIKFLDADDWLELDCVRQQLERQRQLGGDVTFGRRGRTRDDGENVSEVAPPFRVGQVASREWLLRTGPMTTEPLYPTEQLRARGGFRVGLPRGHEYELTVRYALGGVAWVYDGVQTYVQRDHQSTGRISNRLPADLDPWLRPVLGLIEDVEAAWGDAEAFVIRSKHAHWLWNMGRMFLRRGDHASASRCFAEARAMCPADFVEGGGFYRAIAQTLGPRAAEAINVTLRGAEAS